MLSFPWKSTFLHSQQASTNMRIPPLIMNMSKYCSHTKRGQETSDLLAFTACWKAIYETLGLCAFLPMEARNRHLGTTINNEYV